MDYYVQEIAKNYLRNVTETPKTMKVHPHCLYGVEKEQFEKGFLALLELVRSLYADIAADPASFGMLLKENIEADAKNTDYTNSNSSFTRVPNLLLAIGCGGELQEDFSLRLGGQSLLDFAKTLKITNLPFLLGKLKDYGFDIAGYKKSVAGGDDISVSYPDNRYLTVALKAMAESLVKLNKGDIKKSKNYFYMMHNGLLENDPPKAPKLTVDAIYHTLDGENQKYAASLNDIAAPISKLDIRMGGFMRNDWSAVYTGIKNKKVLMSLKVNQNELTTKLNLQNIGRYVGQTDDFPQSIRETMKSAWECGHCHDSCAGGFAFEMDGKSYNKCRGGAFTFTDLSAETVPYYERLLKLEVES